MSYSDVEFGFSLQSVPRDVEQKRFGHFRAWPAAPQGRDATTLVNLLNSMRSEDATLFQSDATSPAIYGVFLMLAEGLRLSLEGNQPDFQEVAYIVGLAIQHSLTPEEEAAWSQVFSASKGSKIFPVRDSGEYKYPELSSLPMSIVKGFTRHGRNDIARAFLTYAYFGYRDYYNRLLTDSSDQARWRRNLLELTARLMMPMRVPVSKAPVFKPPFMASHETEPFVKEHIEILRLLGCAYAALRQWSSDSEFLSAYRSEAANLIIRKGRPAARTYLQSLYGHSLEIPTYAHQELADSLQL